VETVGFTAISVLSAEDGEVKQLKIIIFVMIGEKGFLRDRSMIFMPNG
jgi:hypothetical protein